MIYIVSQYISGYIMIYIVFQYILLSCHVTAIKYWHGNMYVDEYCLCQASTIWQKKNTENTSKTTSIHISTRDFVKKKSKVNGIFPDFRFDLKMLLLTQPLSLVSLLNRF